MSDIEWTGETLNPIRARLRSDPSVIGWHCEHASPGCQHCYSESRNRSGRCNLGTKLPFKPGHRKDVEIFLDVDTLLKPLTWRKPRTIFLCSMTDLFGDFVPDEMIDRVFAVMALCPQHTFQVLTKRADRMRAYFAAPSRIDGGGQERGREIEIYDQWVAMREAWRRAPLGSREHEWSWRDPPLGGCQAALPLPNVWLGVSVEDQQRADERIPDLLATPAAVRFLSCEPLLGPVNLSAVPWDVAGYRMQGALPTPGEPDDFRFWHHETQGIRWVICGGESGAGARAMDTEWARSLRDQCAAAGVPFFFKQWGAWWPFDQAAREWGLSVDEARGYFLGKTNETHALIGKGKAGRLLDGAEHNGMPPRAPA